MLDGKKILITGAGSGIGRASAIAFARWGAHVAVCDLHPDGGEATVEEITAAGGVAAFCKVDVSNEADVERMVGSTVDRFGRLDGAFNNAGIGMRNKSVMDLTEADWRAVLDVNLTGVFFCIKHEMRAMRETGGGSIVNAASAAGLRGQINAGDYVTSKHGVIGLTRTAAIEGGQIGIRVNALCPGLTMTPLTEELMRDPVYAPTVDELLKRHVIGRFGMPDDIANAAGWLLSDMSSWITGTPLSVDGGLTV